MNIIAFSLHQYDYRYNPSYSENSIINRIGLFLEISCNCFFSLEITLNIIELGFFKFFFNYISIIDVIIQVSWLFFIYIKINNVFKININLIYFQTKKIIVNNNFSFSFE